jgi:hypothetical protein
MKIKMYAILDKVKPHTENMRLKLGGGHLYVRSSAEITVVV